MNLKAINKTWALVNKNAQFFKYKKPRFNGSIQVGKNYFWKCLNFFAFENAKNENETDAASAACFQNIKYQVEYNVWSLKIRSGIVY